MNIELSFILSMLGFQDSITVLYHTHTDREGLKIDLKYVEKIQWPVHWILYISQTMTAMKSI